MKYSRLLLFLIFLKTSLFSQSVGGTLSSNTTVCQGINNGTLTVTSYSGTIQRWEYALTATGPWTPLVFTAPSYNYINLIQSTYFRVVVQQTGFQVAYSNPISVLCDQPSVGGTISTNTFQCINSSVTSTLSGNTGSVLSWEYSTNSWISSNTLTTINTLTASLASLTTSTQIRTKIQNGVCPVVYSNTLTVIPAALSYGGSISGTQSVCAMSNSSTLTLSNYTGSIQQWETSASAGGPYLTIASSANTNTISYSNLNQNTWYRAIVKNGNCPASASTNFSVHVDAPSIGGSIVGPQNVCAGINSGTLQLLANAGQVTQWEYSTNGSAWSTVINSNLVQNFSNLSSSCLYRAIVQNGLCPSALSNQFTVNVFALPTVTFNLANACNLSSAQFTNSTSGPNSYGWDFGDAGSANIYNPSHLYSTAGTYTIKLSATNSAGCTDSLKKIITIYPNPSASIVSADTACYGTSLMFTNASGIISGNILSTKFNFNDGTGTTTLSPVQHSFMSDGTYSVYLIAVSNFGCKDSTLKHISIYPKPNSNFFAGNVCKGSVTLFNNLSLLSNGSLQHSWNFGNGNFSSLISPNFIYPNAGTYTVSLISNSNHNCKDTTYKTITVNEKPMVTLSATNTCPGLPVNFGTSISPANIGVSLTVNFGDGNNSNTSNPTHHYSTSGTFVSGITVITDSGCVSSASKNITIYSKPFANFSFNNACNADSVKFNNTSTIASGNMQYTWNMSALTTSTLSSPAYFYNTPGTYTISLVATSNFDCTDTIIKPITIFDAPKSDFKFSNACNGFPVTFTNSSTVNSGVIHSTYWDFGDNSTANVLNPSKDYLNNGSYSVTLISTSSNGCSDTIKKTVNVYEGPVAKFSATSQCHNTPIRFTNSSLLSSGSYSSAWRFGDENYSDLNSPTHLFSKPGSYLVWLKTTSADFCTDSVSSYVETFGIPKISAGKDTTLDKGLGITLQASGAKSFNWLPTYGLNDPTLKNPFSNPDTSTTYFVEGSDENGCKGYDTVTVKINDSFLVTPYNIVTPDGNGKNDTWLIKNIQAYKENKVVIFDQWSQKIFEKEGYNNEWDGKNKTGEILPDATYYYILTFGKSQKKYSGYITLIRNK